MTAVTIIKRKRRFVNTILILKGLQQLDSQRSKLYLFDIKPAL